MNSSQPGTELVAANLLDLHLAVVSGSPGRDGAFELGRPVIYGTAFPILPGIFVTAAHVFESARSDAPHVALCRVGREGGQRSMSIQVVNDCEIFSGVDLAIMKCDGHQELAPLPLWLDPLEVFTPVSAAGFAVGFDLEYRSFVHRGFAGHVVARRELFHMKPQQPPGYELSFIPPPGLSGAPLVIESGNGHFAAGYIVHWWRTVIDGEDYRLGVAVDVEVLLGIQSAIVGGSVAAALGIQPRRLRAPTPAASG